MVPCELKRIKHAGKKNLGPPNLCCLGDSCAFQPRRDNREGTGKVYRFPWSSRRPRECHQIPMVFLKLSKRRICKEPHNCVSFQFVHCWIPPLETLDTKTGCLTNILLPSPNKPLILKSLEKNRRHDPKQRNIYEHLHLSDISLCIWLICVIFAFLCVQTCKYCVCSY